MASPHLGRTRVRNEATHAVRQGRVVRATCSILLMPQWVELARTLRQVPECASSSPPTSPTIRLHRGDRAQGCERQKSGVSEACMLEPVPDAGVAQW
jgi:hypothetical protein